MNYIVCPKCETENSVYRSICVNCGENLMDAKVSLGFQTPSPPVSRETQPLPSSPQTSPPESREAQPSPSYPQRSPLSSTSSTAAQRRTPNPSNALRFPTKYSALKGIADLCNTIAVIMAVIATIIGFIGFIIIFAEGAGIGLAVIVLAALVGVSGYVAYKLIAESIYVILDIEMNSRQTAAYLKYLIDHD